MAGYGTLVVTGGSRGIGAAVCRAAAARGWPVAVNYQSNAKAADELVSEILAHGGQAAAIQGNVAEPADVTRIFDTAEQELGAIGGLVNNAGITGKISRLDEAEIETIRQTVDINVLGALYCAREAVRRISRKHGGHGGRIVNISSAAATLGSPGEYVWYAASKGAVDSLTVGLSKEVAGDGIRVNGVAPGLTETDIHAESSQMPDRVERLGPQIPMARAGTPEEVAAAVMWLLASDSSYVTGTTIRVAGGR